MKGASSSAIEVGRGGQGAAPKPHEATASDSEAEAVNRPNPITNRPSPITNHASLRPNRRRIKPNPSPVYTRAHYKQFGHHYEEALYQSDPKHGPSNK